VIMLVIFFSISFLFFQTTAASNSDITPEIRVNAAILQYPGNWDVNLDIFEILNQSLEVYISWGILNISDPLDSFYNYELIYITGFDSELSLTVEESEKLALFVENGGTIWIDNSDGWQVVNFFLPFSFSEYAYADVRRSEIVNASHPLIDGKYLISDSDVCEFGDELYYHYINIESPEYQVLIIDSLYDWPLTVYASHGWGKVLITSQSIGKGIIREDPEDLKFGYNVLYWVESIARKSVYLSDPSCTVSYSDTIIINTTLTDEEGKPIPNKNITFEYAIIEENWLLIGNATTNENGIASISFLANTVPGNYRLKVSFAGDKYYKPAEALGWLVVTKETTILTLMVEDCTFSDEARFIAILTDNDGVPLEGCIIYFDISMDGENWEPLGESATNESGIAVFSWVCNITPGEYFVRAVYDGNEYYLGSKSETSFVINKEITEIIISPVSVRYSDSVMLSAQLIDDDNTPLEGFVLVFEVSENGADWILIGENTTDENGIVVLEWICDLMPGDYILRAYFAGNTHFLASETQIDLLVEKEITQIYVYHVQGNYSDLVELYATISDDEGNAVENVPLEFYVFVNDGWTLIGSAISDENGKAILDYIIDLPAGSYDLKVVFKENEYYMSSSEVLEEGLIVLPEQVVISISLEEHIYLLVPTVINVSLTDNENETVPYVYVVVLINDTPIMGTKTPENGSFSFTWTPEELAIYNLTIISIESPYYVGEKETLLIFVEFSFENLILEAINELDYIETTVDFPCILSRIRITKQILYRALDYSREGDYWKAFLRIRCATCLIESMLRYHKLEESVRNMLEHVAFKLATAVRYKVLEALEAAEGIVAGFEEDLQLVGEILLNIAWRLYNDGVEKISEGKYSLAISKFIMAYRFTKIISHLYDHRKRIAAVIHGC